MRDDKIIGMTAANANNVARLYKQIVRMDARVQAIERVLSSRKAFLVAILSPRSFWSLVNSKQQALLADHDRQIEEAARVMEEERKKPKLTMVRP